MKLPTALVCLQCEEILDGNTKQCPSCGSLSLWLLAKWFKHTHYKWETVKPKGKK